MKMQNTENLNIQETVPLISPKELKHIMPMDEESNATVVKTRNAIHAILQGEDSRLMAIVGPCSIHDPSAALEYAQRLQKLSQEVSSHILLLMRVYFEKPRTTIGWKGYVSDPHLNDSCDMSTGLREARRLLLRINSLGMPAATEFLDPVVPQYLADLISWAAIGARTTESQTHRQMASGLSMPVGFKNGTDGGIQVAIDAMQSARNAHSFLGLDSDGRTCIVKTKGNIWGHLVLRGGRASPNYDEASIALAERQLSHAGLKPKLIVDCSHGNTGKRYALQGKVWDSVVEQRRQGSQALAGVMVESNLFEGSQSIPMNLNQLRYGVSITDECIGWETTEALIKQTYVAMTKKNE